MNQLTLILMNFLEQKARPHVQQKVTEQINTTKCELKDELPNTVMNYLKGGDANGNGNAMISQIIDSLGPNLMSRVSSVTDASVDTASEGMDTLLTNGVIKITKNVLTQNSGDGQAGEGGGINFDFLKSGREGMVNTTLAASTPVIKQVSDNVGSKLSSSLPAAIGGAIQKMIDENSALGISGALGMAAGFVSMFMGGDESGDQTVDSGGDVRSVEASGGHTGGIQQMLQNLLAPQISLLLQPYLQEFEAQMTETLANELRNKVFSADYIKQSAVNIMSGNGQGGGAGAVLGGVVSAVLNNGGQNGQKQVSGQAIALGAIGSLASSIIKNRG
ncbi:hypothetical protein BGZ51_002800 [Haplosporangium sp. Z 767]|nr:hypothetical protein BGZ51_002800 [Haplosporangium sp. Z 767]KAF9195871.1 hypothetical protein BGZ50_003132 [Haplosporangium sp. Z 11]